MKPSRPLLLTLALALPCSPAHAIEDGFIAEPCAWPEVVRVFSGWGPVEDENGPETIVCTGVYIGGRTVLTAADCVQLQPAPYEIQFSDAFGPNPHSTDRMRMSIPIDECRTHPSISVAACTLREAPTMQAIPVVAPCEAAGLLSEGAELFVVGANLEKRWARASLDNDLPAGPSSFELSETIWTTMGELSSQVLELEDLGAPLYVRAPDGSLRIAALAASHEPTQWIGTWALADWLLDTEPQDVVSPCHSLAGAWQPGPQCTSLIAERSVGAGAWGRGPMVCSTDELVAPTPTCAP